MKFVFASTLGGTVRGFLTSKKHARIWMVFITLAIVAGATLLPVAGAPGWPKNHESDSFMLRTLVYASHMNQGDLFPIWSSEDNDGFGSAQPALYHKLFYLVSGGLVALSGAMKSSLLVALWGWLVIGAAGAYRLCRQADCEHGLALCGGVMLLLANYTVTNWLVRGAMAELSAAMLVPWVLSGFINSLRKSRFTGGLAAAMGLLFLAHSVIAYFLAILLALTGLCLLVTRYLPPRILRPASIGWPLGIFALMTAPYLGIMALFGRDYDLKRILAPVYLPWNQFQAPLRYIRDIRWRWGHTWEGFTVQLDFPVIVLLVGGGAFLIWRHFHRDDHSKYALPLGGRVPVLALALVGTLALFLQTSWATPFYRNVPGAVFIQFPWRLLAVLTPVSIALALVTAQHVATSTAIARWLAVVALLAMGVSSGAVAPIQYASLADRPLTLNGVRFSAFNEYVPRRAGNAIFTGRDVYRQISTEGCAIEEINSVPEALVRKFLVVCVRSHLVALPLFASPLHRLIVSTAGFPSPLADPMPCAAAHQYFPGLCTVELPSGRSLVEVHQPTFGILIGTLLTRD